MNPKARGVRWLDADAAARHLGFVDPVTGEAKLEAFYSWRRRAARPPRTHWLGSKMRFREVDLDACIESLAPGVDVEPPMRLVRGAR